MSTNSSLSTVPLRTRPIFDASIVGRPSCLSVHPAVRLCPFIALFVYVLVRSSIRPTISGFGSSMQAISLFLSVRLSLSGSVTLVFFVPLYLCLSPYVRPVFCMTA